MPHNNRFNRRVLLANSASASAALFAAPSLARARDVNGKLNIALIGVAGRGSAQLGAAANAENVVALCDVDSKLLGAASVMLPKAKIYSDFRKMFDEMGKRIDAVMVSTPDHTHAAASAMAMRLGKHCYCEKPLAHSVSETRTLTEIARKNRLVTQLGTQIHAGANYRRAVELIWADIIGKVREVHVWLNADFQRPPTPQGGTQPNAPADRPPVPPNLKWDLWLGPAPNRPYHPAYAPFRWRYWWAFGNGVLGDFFCHYCDLAFWALKLRYPATIEAQGPLHPESTARWTIARQEYPARGDLPPVKLHWYHGGTYPELVKKKDVPRWPSAVLFVGSEGMLIADYGRHELLPKAKFSGFKPPAPTIPNSIGHHQEWFAACKAGTPTTCNFDYSGPLTEAALLCNVALRTSKKLEWDAAALRTSNCPEADQYIRRAYRDGWCYNAFWRCGGDVGDLYDGPKDRVVVHCGRGPYSDYRRAKHGILWCYSNSDHDGKDPEAKKKWFALHGIQFASG